MGNVLNLKEHEGEDSAAPTGEHDIVPPSAGASIQEDDEPSDDESLTALTGLSPEAISWESSTKPDAVERRKEHVMLGLLGVFAVIVAFWQQSFALIAIAGLTILAWEMRHRHGHDMNIDIDPNGIGVNGRRHRFDRFKSFHIQELPDGTHHLSVMPASALSPAIRAPLGEQNHEEVRAILASYLVEDEHPIPVSELFLKS